MKLFVPLAVLVTCAFFLNACSRPQEHATLKLQHFVPPYSPIHAKAVAPWCEKIEKESEGKLQCEIYPAMQLGGTPAQLYDQVRDGVIDIALTVPGYSPGRFPSIEAFELPFMMTDPETTSKAVWDYVAENKLGEFDDVQPLAFIVHGHGILHMADKPITNRADFAGMKIRAPTRQTNKMIAQLGGVPVGMPLPQAPEALAKGVIDGIVVPYEVMPAIKANELTKYHSETHPSQPSLYTTVLLLAMNKVRYQNLSAEQKAVLDANSGVVLSGHIGRVLTEADRAARGTLPEASINVIPVAEVQEWIRLTRPVADDWVEEMNQRGLDGNALLNSARHFTEKHGG